MSNLALTTDGRELAKVESGLRRYLPGLDVRLMPFGPRQAIVRQVLMQALALAYPGDEARRVLESLGVVNLRPITDAEAIQLLTLRDPANLPRRTIRRAVSAIPGLDWHLENVRAPAAWQLLGGPDAIDWHDIRVGQIDTGYTRHPVFGFEAAPWLDTADAATFFPEPPAGDITPFPTEIGNGIDNLQGTSGGHGTRIGGTITGHAPGASGGAYFGVAPKVPLVPVRITDIVWINHAQREFGQAVDHLLQVGGVQVINVSLGVFLSVVVAALRRAINKAYDQGVIVVCAAGNIVDPVVAPAALPRTIAVGGTTQADVPWSGSSFGPQVDFSAPAADLRRASTDRRDRFSYGQGGDGTSYASAITSGAAALWLAHHHGALQAAYPLPWQRVEAFAMLARTTARQPPGWQPGSFGTGILDIEALLNAPLPDASTLTPAPQA